jgi:hypothetical protein
MTDRKERDMDIKEAVKEIEGKGITGYGLPQEIPSLASCVEHSLKRGWPQTNDFSTIASIAGENVFLRSDNAGLLIPLKEKIECPDCAEREEAEREEAEQKISDNEYAGFAGERGWRCVCHTIDDYLGGDWRPLLAFATGETTDFPDGIDDAWNSYTSPQYLQSTDDLPEGIFCEHKDEDGEVCGAEIFRAREDEEEEEDE